MRRTLILLILIPALAAGIFLGAFAVSELNVRGQSFSVSLSDFVFLNHGAWREVLGRDVPPLTEARYRSVIGRFRQHTHHYVEHQALWWLARWGEAAVPLLVEELRESRDYARTRGAIRALGEIGGEEAATALAELLTGLDRRARYEQVYYRTAIAALGKMPLPTASRALIAVYERHPEPENGFVLAELGRTATPEALAYLLTLAQRGPLPGRESADLIWGLAMSRSPQGAQVLIDWMGRSGEESARLCRDALDQFGGAEALEPLLDALAAADNDPQRATLLDLLDGPWVAASPRTISLLTPLLTDPWLGDAVRDTLARSGSREAWQAVQTQLPTGDGRAWLADQRLFPLFYRFGGIALPDLVAQLRTARPQEQAAALELLPRLFRPEARPYLEALRTASEPQIAAAARTALLRQDKVDLFRSFTLALPPHFGELAWQNFRPDWFFMEFSYEAGFEAVWNVFAWLHLGGLVLSFLLGWALLTNTLRVFESYRFTLFLLFLLAEGLVGDFLFADHWPIDAGLGYRIATAMHLLLLIGFLARERERLPGELRSRFERLGGASLWLLLPLLLVLGTPVYADALRLALRQWPNFYAFCLLLTVLTALVIEQALIPRHRLPRLYGVERALAFGLSLWLLALFGLAVQRLALLRLAAGDRDGALLCWLLLAPLPWFLLLHLQALRPREWWRAGPPSTLPPGERLRLAGHGPELTVHLLPPLQPGQRWLRGALQVSFVLAAAVAVAILAGRGNGLDAMILAVFAGLIGAALAGMLLQGLAPRVVFQVRGGYIRCGRPRYGGVLGGSPWLRRLSGPASSGCECLDPEEQGWLRSLQEGGAAGTPPVDPSLVAVFARPAQGAGDPERGLPVQIGLRNHGSLPVTLAALEQASHGRFATATVDGAPAALCFDAATRNRVIPPGRDATLPARLFPALAPQGRGAVQVEILGATVQTAPFCYALQEGE